MDKNVYLSCSKCPGKYPANKFTKCPTCNIDLAPEEPSSSQVQSGSENVQAGRDVIITVNEKEKLETVSELKKTYSKIFSRMKLHRSELKKNQSYLTLL